MLFKLFKIILIDLFLSNIDESIHSIVMFLNCKFIRCYIKSMFDYFLGTQKAPISWEWPEYMMEEFSFRGELKGYSTQRWKFSYRLLNLMLTQMFMTVLLQINSSEVF